MKKHAIMILAHSGVDLLNKLLELLDSKYFDIYLHLDIKSDILDHQLYSCQISDFFLYRKYDVIWADYSMVETELFLFEEAHKMHYEYYHLISGCDLPLKTNKEIYTFFHNNFPKEFIHFEDSTVLDYKLEWIQYYHNVFRTKNDLSAMNYDFLCTKKQQQDGINRIANDTNTFRFGANWVSVTDELIEYILSKRGYIEERFPFTKSSDEIFIQTLVYNSKFRERLFYDKYDSNYVACMRLIDWQKGCPYVWQNCDYDVLKSSDRLFARKFDDKIDSEIINRIYEDIKKSNEMDENCDF